MCPGAGASTVLKVVAVNELPALCAFEIMAVSARAHLGRGGPFVCVMICVDPRRSQMCVTLSGVQGMYPA